MKIVHLVTCSMIVCGLLCFSPVIARAADDNTDNNMATSEGGVTVNGFTYNIAKDRKVVNVGGLYQPEDLDQYMKRRFDSLDSQMRTMTQKIDRLNDQLIEMNKKEKPAKGLVLR